MSTPEEALVVLHPSSKAGVEEVVVGLGAATQVASRRVAVLTASPAALEILRARPEVARVWSSNERHEEIPDLTEAEALFVASWFLRRNQPKPRPGEGEAWDAPGREAP